MCGERLAELAAFCLAVSVAVAGEDGPPPSHSGGLQDAPLVYSGNVEDSVLLRVRYMETLNGENWLSPPTRYLGDDLLARRLDHFESGVRRRLEVKGIVSQVANAPKDLRFLHLFNPLAPPEYFGPEPSSRRPDEHSFDFNVFGDATLSGQLAVRGR